MMSLACQVNVSSCLKLNYDCKKRKKAGAIMATNKRVFTLRLSDEVFDKIGLLATQQHRSVTNYIEFVLLEHLRSIAEAQSSKDSKEK